MRWQVTILFILLSSVWAGAYDFKKAGKLNAALESNSAVYIDDPAIGPLPERWGSNNYLKLDWQLNSFSAGLQAEWYPQALAGYPSELKGASLTSLYFEWSHKLARLHAGSYHLQLGSGLLMRSWEDRNLGINNIITGGLISMQTTDRWLQAKVFGGVPKYGPWPSWPNAVAGADISLDLLPAFGVKSDHCLRIEGSALDRVAVSTEEGIAFLAGTGGVSVPVHVPGVSARIQYSWKGFSLKGEYVWKGRDFYTELLPKSSQRYCLKDGNAQIIEAVATAGPFSGTITLRRLENMTYRIFNTSSTISPANTLNYLPALCMQQTYMLAGLNPYETYADGEAGLQGDLFWNFKRGTALGGRYGMKLHVAGSWIEALPFALPDRNEHHLAYRDINIELEKRWTKEFRTILFVSIQENSATHGNRNATNAQNVFVFDGLYKFNPTMSLRWELQYLFSKELSRDWMAALAEFSLAPHWSFTVSDMYNHGGSGVHYFNVAASYTWSSLNISLMGGRNREGMICSGGVCRWQPAFTGVVLRILWSI
ncbi:MAG: hypothetical protein J5764_00635 [Bacteroidales bacterium]|nr:hypothetical protein [Bacteroidales bacterium]